MYHTDTTRLLIAILRIATVICSVGFAVIFGVAVFLALGPIKLWLLRRQRAAEQKDDTVRGHPPIREAGERFADQEARVQRILSQRTKRDSIRPDIYSPVLMPAIPEGANPPALSIGTAFAPQLGYVTDFSVPF